MQLCNIACPESLLSFIHVSHRPLPFLSSVTLLPLPLSLWCTADLCVCRLAPSCSLRPSNSGPSSTYLIGLKICWAKRNCRFKWYPNVCRFMAARHAELIFMHSTSYKSGTFTWLCPWLRANQIFPASHCVILGTLINVQMSSNNMGAHILPQQNRSVGQQKREVHQEVIQETHDSGKSWQVAHFPISR